jgi:hypothetical protein
MAPAGKLGVVDVHVVVAGVGEDRGHGRQRDPICVGRELPGLPLGQAVGGVAVGRGGQVGHDRAVFAARALVDVGAGGRGDLVDDEHVAQGRGVAVDAEDEGLAPPVPVTHVAAHGGVGGHLVAAPEVGLLQPVQVTGEGAVQGGEQGAAGDRCGQACASLLLVEPP